VDLSSDDEEDVKPLVKKEQSDGSGSSSSGRYGAGGCYCSDIGY
jgi:hypothetical protein